MSYFSGYYWTTNTIVGPIVISGGLTVSGGVGITGGLTVDALTITGAFVVPTFSVTNLTVTGTLTSAASVITGTENVGGNFYVNINKFTVAAASGNTVIAGTLGVTGIITDRKSVV